MNKNKIYYAVVFITLATFTSVSSLFAQRGMDYRDLAMKQQQQPMHFNTIILPGDSDSTVTFASVFSISYDYLPFRKYGDRSSENEFFSTVDLSLEILNPEETQENSLNNMQPVTRTHWEDSVFAQTYEQTQSGYEFVEGNLPVTLEPGTYSYVIQMTRGNKTESQVSRSQKKRVRLYNELNPAPILYGEHVDSQENPSEMKLSTMGDNVEYGHNFFALAHLPDYSPDASYSLHINQLQVNGSDTSNIREVHSQELSPSDIHTGLKPEIANDNKENVLRLSSSEPGYTYALVEIPNRTFPNATFQVYIQHKEDEEIIAQNHFQSNWRDIPTSLLSLDVAIDMLRFIVNDETLREIDSGSAEERRKKFHEFWDQRDPTPETDYNELMAEYYRRIDYTYENFTTENTIGYESDRGEVYINFGAPENIERKFPKDGATIEIWEYDNRRFVFQATTGFGDFRLMSD